MKLRPLLLLLSLCAAVGCASTPKTSIYLVADPEGQIGEVSVTNDVSTVLLTEENEKLAAGNSSRAFRKTRIVEASEIEEKFSDALASLPERPAGFSIYFDSDSSQIKRDSRRILDEVLAEIKRRDSRDISLNGHTDRQGDAQLNMPLSLKRADRVKNFLLEKGISEDYITVEFYGESKPVIPTVDDVSEPKNRRVEVVVR
jgi:outer membrane protein OmpA-like peptidoglycan-associated protein